MTAQLYQLPKRENPMVACYLLLWDLTQRPDAQSKFQSAAWGAMYRIRAKLIKTLLDDKFGVQWNNL